MRDIKLSSLRICLEVMRRESLTAAARALNMTQSAVSKNVQLVEDQLGMPLFQRLKDGVIPHDHARAVLFRIADGIATIDAALAELADPEHATLRLVAPPIIAQKFLIPNLDDLHVQHPGIELVFRVRAASTRRNVETDAEIFFSGGGALPAEAQWLAGDRFWVVAHPGLAPQPLPIEHVTRYPLLQHVKVERAWQGLAERFGLDFSGTKLHYYEQYSLIIDAALQKLGIAVIPRFLVADIVAAGRLHRIGDEIAFPKIGYYYQLIRREKVATSRTFFDWLRKTLLRSESAA